MACSEEANKYNNVTDILVNTFGAVLDRDTIYSIVESCCGDLNYAANAIMSITSEDNSETTPGQSTSHYGLDSTDRECQIINKSSNVVSATSDIPKSIQTTENQTDIAQLARMSFAEASTSNKKEKITKQVDKSKHYIKKIDFRNESNIWTEQIRHIVTRHNQGIRTLIIMRGAPGSGKTHLAYQIQEMTVGADPKQLHIFSTDDYFMVNGYYTFDKSMLQHAHLWNQHRAVEALNKGVSPVIIDNTNIEIWEIAPYAKAGVNNGYLLEVVEPNTRWARNLHQLTNRNVHRVPSGTIKRMLEMVQVPISSTELIINLKLVYPKQMEPPVLRCLPSILPYSNNNEETATEKKTDISPMSCQKGLENPYHKKEVEEYKSTFTIQSNIEKDYELEICQGSTSTLSKLNKESFVKEASSKNLLNIEKQKLNLNEAIIVGQGDEMRACDEKQMDSDEVKTITIDKKITLEPGLTYKGESKNEVYIEKNPILSSTEEDYNVIQNLPQTSQSMENIKHDMSLKSCSLSPEPVKSTDICNHTNIEKLLEEFQKVENEWDNGGAWEEDLIVKKQEPISTKSIITCNPKSPRTRKIQENDKFLPVLENYSDWRNMFSMPSTSQPDFSNLSPKPKIEVETKSTETCMEFGDRDISSIKNGRKIISARARDINLNYSPNLPEKIPENSKFDKSSMTNENVLISGPHRCQNEEKHFIRFRNMFKHIKEDHLRDIFDNCCGDVNWAVSIIIDDMPNNEFHCITLDEGLEIGEDSDEPCTCTSMYGIIPDRTPTNLKEENNLNIALEPSTSAAISSESSILVRKIKKDSLVSDLSLALKRQIEQNVVISDQHYSEACLKVRKKRRGDSDGDTSNSQNIGTGITVQRNNESDNFDLLNVDTSDTDTTVQDVSGPSTFDVIDSESNSDEESLYKEAEKTININLGYEFISQIDALFGRADMMYSENIQPKINMPISLLNEINILWMESLMSQLEAESKANEEMIKQDEQLARSLYMKQAETTKSKVLETPNFKELMDMEFALSLYRKDCEECMEKERPTDLAAKLSAKKLYDLFPEIAQKDLDEIFMAYHYNFRATVKLLLETQGRTDITKDKNGINKFIMAQEIKRKEKFVAEEKKRLMEENVPALPNKVNMDTVNDYRDKAKLHLSNWNKNFGKAKNMMTKNEEIANYYQSLADLHLLKYERANSIAAVSLMQIHAVKSRDEATLDLHYLHVEEAKAALDVFLDTHIQRHKMSYSRDKIYPLIYIITGRGLHSRGGPKIKPAVKSQLRYRGLNYKELNPGMLSVRISSEAKLSYEIP